MVLAGAAGFFVLSLLIIGLLRQEFVPAQDTSRFQLRFQTPVGTSIDVTDSDLQADRGVPGLPRPRWTRFFGFIGGVRRRRGQHRDDLRDHEGARRPPAGREDRAAPHPAGVHGRRARRGRTRSPACGPASWTRRSRGSAPPAAAASPWRWPSAAGTGTCWPQSAQKIMEEMRASGVVTDVDSDYQVGMPEVRVIPDRNKAADLGISMAAIGETINAAIGGVRVGKFKDQGPALRHPRAPARRRSASGRRTSSGCSCARPGASLVRLGDIVRIEQQPTLQAITRKDRERAITIFANVAQGRLPGRGPRQDPGDRRGAPARRLPRHPLGHQPGLQGVVRLAGLRVRAWAWWWPTWSWPRSSTPSPTPSRSCWPCRSASAARSWRSGSPARA